MAGVHKCGVVGTHTAAEEAPALTVPVPMGQAEQISIEMAPTASLKVFCGHTHETGQLESLNEPETSGHARSNTCMSWRSVSLAQRLLQQLVVKLKQTRYFDEISAD